MIFDLYFFQTERSVPLLDKKPMLPLFIYCAFHCALHTYHNQISHLIYDIFLFFPAKYHARQTRNPSCCTRRMTDALTDNSDKRVPVLPLYLWGGLPRESAQMEEQHVWKKNVRLVEPETFPESKHFPELPTAEGYNGIGHALIKRNSPSPFMGMKAIVLACMIWIVG